ncbi:hypothetical protein ED733_000938 [Metarhizium rileyi]|uniref:Uncharacterized protein n=1 Tax=Metarhizium rileyi (strain RCEF 4871) TaxID=1649241 RepID=A0A5C6G4G0_METRR|nr:hypothetical protein ED733_000938 [Metarhizium rileyi]
MAAPSSMLSLVKACSAKPNPDTSRFFCDLLTLFVPGVISLIIFLFLTFVIVPIWRRYRNRYSQYLPIESISNHTTGLRHRIINRFSRLALPSTWSRNRGSVDNPGAEDFLDDGEELGDMDEQTLNAIQRLHSHLRSGFDSNRRLSRDLEEGFMDDSDEEQARQ